MRAWGGRSERACRFSQPGMEEDMIRSRSDLKEYLACERALYFGSGEKNTIEQGGACEGISGAAFLKARLQAWLLRSKFHSIWKYLRTLRHAEYHKNQSGLVHRLLFVYYHRKKYVLGNRLGFEIPENCVGKGLMIYHIAPIVINEDARIGEYCCITGNFCAGNTGAGTPSPVLGDHVTAGWGSCVIGDVRVADHVVIGAGCVLTRSVEEDGARVAGVPGRKLAGSRLPGREN